MENAIEASYQPFYYYPSSHTCKIGGIRLIWKKNWRGVVH